MQAELSDDPDKREYEAQMRQMEMESKREQFEFDRSRRSMEMRDKLSERASQTRERATEDERTQLLERLRRLLPEGLEEKQEPRGQNNVSTYTRGGRG